MVTTAPPDNSFNGGIDVTDDDDDDDDIAGVPAGRVNKANLYIVD